MFTKDQLLFFFLQIRNVLQTSSKPPERIGNDTTAISLIFISLLYSFASPRSLKWCSFWQEKKKGQKFSQITASLSADLVYHAAQPPRISCSDNLKLQKIFQLSSKLQDGKKRLKVTDPPTRKMLILTNCSGGSLNHS